MEHRRSLKMFPAVENLLSGSADVAGMERMTWGSLATVGKEALLLRHQVNTRSSSLSSELHPSSSGGPGSAQPHCVSVLRAIVLKNIFQMVSEVHYRFRSDLKLVRF